MYKSSNSTFVFKYVVPVLAPIMFGFVLYNFWRSGSNNMGVIKGMSIMLIWTLFFVYQTSFRIKKIRCDEKGIIVIQAGREKLINYRNIQWVAFHMLCPWSITIKYKDEETGKDRKICFMSEDIKTKNPTFNSSDPMTEYIKSMLKKHNPDYDEKQAPVMWKEIALTFVIGLPFIAISLYFFFPNGFQF